MVIGLQPFDEFEPLVGRRTSRDGQLLYECVLDRCVSYEWFDAQHVLFRYDGRAFFGRKCPETVGHLTIRVFFDLDCHGLPCVFGFLGSLHASAIWFDVEKIFGVCAF